MFSDTIVKHDVTPSIACSTHQLVSSSPISTKG